MQAATASPKVAKRLAGAGAVRRDPSTERDLELLKRHFVFAALEDLPCDPLKTGLHSISYGQITPIERHPIYTRDLVTAETEEVTYKLYWRKPGRIVDTLEHQAGGPADKGGKGFGRINALHGEEREVGDAVQLLTLPVIPATVLQMIAVLSELVDQDLDTLTERALAFVAAALPEGEIRADLEAGIFDAAELLRGREVILHGDGDKTPGAIREMLAYARVAAEHADLHLSRTVSEMEERLKPGGIGKGRADKYDRFLCAHLGRPVPRISRNVFTDPAPGGVEASIAAPARRTKLCFACASEIFREAKLCQHCREWQPGFGPASATDAPAPVEAVGEPDAGDESAGKVIQDGKPPEPPPAQPARRQGTPVTREE